MAKEKHLKQKARRMKENEKRNITLRTILKNKRACIIIVCFIIFVFSTIKLTVWFTSNVSTQNQMKELREEVISESKEENGETTKKIDFSKIKEINQDVVAWIEIPETNIDYPVFQTKDNEYYLEKDMYKNYNSAGSIFLDCENVPDFKDNNTVIYGHNLRSGKMFADLQKIIGNQLGNDIKIKVYTEKEEKQYKVFSSYISEPIKEPIQTILEDKSSFITNAIKKSKINFSTKPGEKDNLLTLSTCDNKGKRIIVHAVEI